MSKLKKHPDLGGNFEEAQAINEAYETLSDPAKRAAYDMEKCVELRSNEKENRQERRRVPRKNVDAKVSYCVSDEEIWHFARVKDVSVLGIRLQSKKSFGIGKKLVIVPDNASKAAMHGIVRWQRMFHPSNFERIYEAGIEFFDQIIDVEDRVQA
jgi:curved DNA-binding protein CbpA